MKNLETFEVGTKVIINTANDRTYLSEIIKETKTQFTCEGGLRFMKATGSMVGSGAYYATYAYAVDEGGLEIVANHKRRALKRKRIRCIQDYNLHDLNSEQLSKVATLLNSFTGE